MRRIKKDALFLIDGSYLLYRSYYGLRPLQTSAGIQTQAIFGFCRTINKLINEFDPQNMILVWDSKGKTFRSDIYEEYKATRQAPPSDLFLQKEAIMQFAGAIGLKQVAKAGYEADDLIGSIVHDYKKRQIVIVGPDKDLYQLLVDDTVLIYDPFKDRIIDAADFKKEKGFGPEKVAFFYSLVGDVSDNIPGVKGIGEKGAKEIVKKFDSLEDLYKNLDKIKKERIRQLLEGNKDDAFLSFKLFSLKNVKLSLKAKDFAYDKDNWVNAAPFFHEYEFSSLLKDLKKRFDLEKIVPQQAEGQQLSIFKVPGKKGEEKKTIKAKKWNCFVVQTQEGLDQLINLAKKKKMFAFDTEATGYRPLQDELVGFSFAFDKKNAYYVPFVHKANGEKDQLEREKVLEQLKPIFESERIKKVLHHTKFDQLMMWQCSIKVEPVVFDTLIAANLLRHEEGEKINLKALSARYLNEPMQSFKDVLGSHKDFSHVPISQASEYAAHDALQTFKLKPILEKGLKKDKKIKKIFEDIEMPLSQVLLKMEAFGITLDEQKLKEVGKEIDKDLHVVEKKAHAAIERKRKGKRINLNSPQQIEKLLFDELKLPVIKKSGKGQRSTDQEVLAELSKINPIPGVILRYRELAKLRSTYVEPLIKQVNPNTGRIHTTYSQTMVATGRLSSSEPNLQNIPVGSDHGGKIRSAFIAPHGKIFLAADYSQVELRVLAHLAHDKSLIDAFLHNKDIHAETASQMFDVPLSKITPQQRQVGKRINFGIAYGQTPFGLSRDLGIKPSEAKDYIDKYFDKFKGVAKWVEKTVENAKKDGYTTTWLGRRRYLPGIREKNRTLFEAARRMAINSPVQGTSAEILKLAMIELDKLLTKKKLETAMVLQIHDELVLELPQDEEKMVEKLVKKCMEGVVKWSVPFEVSIKTGKNWEKVSK